MTLTNSLVGFAALLVAATAAAQSWHDDSHYVALGAHRGYYVVRPGSALQRQLGLERAPVSDTADPFRHGYGADAVAFHFDRFGRLADAPAYVAQAQLNDFYTRRLASFVRGRSTVDDVKLVFGHFRTTDRRSDGLVGYYEINVYNSFEDWPGRGGR